MTAFASSLLRQAAGPELCNAGGGTLPPLGTAPQGGAVPGASPAWPATRGEKWLIGGSEVGYFQFRFQGSTPLFNKQTILFKTTRGFLWIFLKILNNVLHFFHLITV